MVSNGHGTHILGKDDIRAGLEHRPPFEPFEPFIGFAFWFCPCGPAEPPLDPFEPLLPFDPADPFEPLPDPLCCWPEPPLEPC